MEVNFPSERALFRQWNGELESYDLVTGEATQVENPSQPEVTLPAMSWELIFSSDGQFASALSLGCDIGGAVATLWDANSGQTLAEESGSCGPYSDLFTPDGQWWVVGTDAGFSLYDLDALPQDSVAQQPTVAVHSPDIGRVYDLTFSADGQTLAALTNDFSTTNIKVYRFADLLAHTEDSPAQPLLDVVVLSQQPMSLSPDGRWLVTREALFEVASGTAYPRPVGNRVAFSSDGTLAAFADNGVVFLVDLTDEPTLLHSLPIVGPSFVGFSPDGTRLYAADRGRVRVFGVPPG
jgi:WD40 repeat protein